MSHRIAQNVKQDPDKNGWPIKEYRLCRTKKMTDPAMKTRVPRMRSPTKKNKAAVEEEEVQVEDKAAEEDMPTKNGVDGNTKQLIS